jgi:hypothetical protein
MRNLMVKLYNDDCGALIAAEWVVVATILVLGTITGLVAVRQAAIAELHDFANALLALNQSYSFSGQSNCQSSTAGSEFEDEEDDIEVRHTRATEGGEDAKACD